MQAGRMDFRLHPQRYTDVPRLRLMHLPASDPGDRRGFRLDRSRSLMPIACCPAGAAGPRCWVLAHAVGGVCGAIDIALLWARLRTVTRLGRADVIVLGVGLATSPALVIWSAS